MPVSALVEPLGGCRFTRSSSWVALSPMRREGWFATFGSGRYRKRDRVQPKRAWHWSGPLADACVREAMTGIAGAAGHPARTRIPARS